MIMKHSESGPEIRWYITNTVKVPFTPSHVIYDANTNKNIAVLSDKVTAEQFTLILLAPIIDKAMGLATKVFDRIAEDEVNILTEKSASLVSEMRAMLHEISRQADIVKKQVSEL